MSQPREKKRKNDASRQIQKKTNIVPDTDFFFIFFSFFHERKGENERILIIGKQIIIDKQIIGWAGRENKERKKEIQTKINRNNQKIRAKNKNQKIIQNDRQKKKKKNTKI